MAARSGGIALFVVLVVGLVAGSRVVGSPASMLEMLGGDNRVLYAVAVGFFAIAGVVAAASGSGLLRVVGRLTLIGCFSFGVMIWSTWNAPPELAEAFEMLDDIDDQFAQVAAALEGVEANLGASSGSTVGFMQAQPMIDGLVLDGHVLVGRQCSLNQVGTGRAELAYLGSGDDPELVQLTVDVIRGEPTVVLGLTTTNGSTPLLPVEPACF